MTLEEIIRKNVHALKTEDLPFEVNKVALIKAIAMRESSFGKNNKPRFEPAFYKGGKYYNESKQLRNLVNKYGRDAACSWGSFQVLFITAYELGYRGTPKNMARDDVCLEYAIKLINERIIKRNPSKLEDIFDGFNSGNFKDSMIPHDYIKYCCEWYMSFLEEELKKEIDDKKEL